MLQRRRSIRSRPRGSTSAGGAAAISVVTEPDHFHGDLGVGRPRCGPRSTLPLLLKDFVVDSYQLLDAAVRGADGVLLLAALLSEMQHAAPDHARRGCSGSTRWSRCTTRDELRARAARGRDAGGHQQPRPAHVRGRPRDLARGCCPRVPPLVTAVAESGLVDARGPRAAARDALRRGADGRGVHDQPRSRPRRSRRSPPRHAAA